MSKRIALLSAAAFSALNPHAWLDTTVLLGSLANAQGASLRWTFATGAATASLLWFVLLAWAAGRMAPLFHAISLVLRLRRDSGTPVKMIANGGSYQQMLQGKLYQMLKLQLYVGLGAIPEISARGEPLKLLYSLSGTNAALDEAAAAFREVVIKAPQLSQLATTVWRLAGELRKTQRRVNALQHIFIPQYEETVAFIISSLEEREREETFRLKWLKTKMTRAQA